MSYSFNRRGRTSGASRSNSSRSFNRGSQRNSFRGSKGRFKYGAQRSNINPAQYVSGPVEVQAEKIYQPQNSFADFGLLPKLLSNVTRHGYTEPTPIQDQAIPVLMNGQDVVGIANTGTGKTAAFLLPLINKLLLDQDQGVLIVTPTRELALQIFEELQAFTVGLRLGNALCIGGMNINAQISRLRNNPHFVIGTPGRLKDLINRGNLKTELFSNIVLDEVDRMLDIGFRPDITFIISHLPRQRHAAFFSATMNRDTEAIMRQLSDNPIKISVKKQESLSNIEQDMVRIKPGQNKADILYEMLIKENEFPKVIVFGRTKHGINKLEQKLDKYGIRVSSIHGNKSQNARQRALQNFKQGRVQALLATDVAARGIDIDDVTHVINFDEPMTYDDYIHRIGRTGRAGKIGKALTFVD